MTKLQLIEELGMITAGRKAAEEKVVAATANMHAHDGAIEILKKLISQEPDEPPAAAPPAGVTRRPKR